MHFIDITEKLKTDKNVGFIDLFSKGTNTKQFKYKSKQNCSVNVSNDVTVCPRCQTFASPSLLSVKEGGLEETVSAVFLSVCCY